MVGVVLIFSALQMGRTALGRGSSAPETSVRPPFAAALLTGALIGFVSGTTGTGGGVFLAPVILSMNWGTARQSAATTAVYNLINSAAALLGAYANWDEIPHELPVWLVAVAAGGFAGAYIGSRSCRSDGCDRSSRFLVLVAGMKLSFKDRRGLTVSVPSCAGSASSLVSKMAPQGGDGSTEFQRA